MRVLVVWEDAQWDSLHRIAKVALNRRRPAGTAAFPTLLGHTSRGNGKFEGYVASTWTNVRANGLPTSGGAIDHLVCVVDADKIAELLGLGAPPVSSDELPT
jgi:hypothetical protein